jgi:IS5 family transposase
MSLMKFSTSLSRFLAAPYFVSSPQHVEPCFGDLDRQGQGRASVPFRVIKRQFGHVKTRYRGLAKNRAQLFTLFALGNLFLVRRKLMA